MDINREKWEAMAEKNFSVFQRFKSWIKLCSFVRRYRGKLTGSGGSASSPWMGLQWASMAEAWRKKNTYPW